MSIKKMIEDYTADIDRKLLQIKHAQTELEKEVNWLKHSPERVDSVIASANRYKELYRDLKSSEKEKQLLVLGQLMIDGGSKSENDTK